MIRLSETISGFVKEHTEKYKLLIEWVSSFGFFGIQFCDIWVRPFKLLWCASSVAESHFCCLLAFFKTEDALHFKNVNIGQWPLKIRH